MKTFVYKLRPSAVQQVLLTETLETCRHLYNHALAERTMAYQERGESICFAYQCARLPALKHESPYLLRVHSQVLQDVLHRVDRAFQAFFRRVTAGAKPGYPRFRGKSWYDSFTYPQWSNGVKLDHRRLVLSKIGTLRLYKDRQIQGTPKICTIVRKADGWYAHIVCEIVPSPLPQTGQAVGVDVGLESFATLSDGSWWKSTLPERRKRVRSVMSPSPNGSPFAGTPARIVGVSCTAIIMLRSMFTCMDALATFCPH